jgi:RNA polymerase sigma factor (sigma-70 family)
MTTVRKPNRQGEDLSGDRSEGLFPSTLWTTVLKAKDFDNAAMECLITRYYQPLLHWSRARFFRLLTQSHEDLVQGFFMHMLKREWLKNVALEKGRFRTFLVTSYLNYVKDQMEKERVPSRGGGAPIESLDETDAEGNRLIDPPDFLPAADQQLDIAFTKQLFNRAFRRLEEEARAVGHGDLISALEPKLFDEESAPGYMEVGAKLGMSEGAVRVAAHRVRERLAELFREEIAKTVGSEEEVSDEIRYLIGLFK